MSIAGLGTPYWYEWEIGLLECLKMMVESDIKSVVLQANEFRALDDVVVNYKDESTVNIQVKHTDINENFTYSFLSSGKDSLLKNLASEWKENKEKRNIREIQICTNKKWSKRKIDGKCSIFDFITEVYPKLKNDFLYSGTSEEEKKAINWFKKEIKFLGDEDTQFIKILTFRQEENKIEVEKNLKKQIAKIIGTNKDEAINICFNNLVAALKEWATSSRLKQEIEKEDVYRVLCSTNCDIPQYELYPEKPIFPSRKKFAKKITDKIQNSDKKMFFIEGMPGAGKTNFVSYLSQLENTIVDFRYYTYLPVSKDNVSYSDDEGYYSGRVLWLSILTQIKKKFEELKILSKVNFPIIYNFLSITEMRKYVLEYLPFYSEIIGRTCYFFIDGVDHAARSIDARNSFLMQLPKPSEIGEGIKFILVGQPVNDKYPSWIIGNKEIEYVSMPSLEINDISKLLTDNHMVTDKIDVKSLANTIVSVIGSNALNVMFAILELRNMTLPLSFEEVEMQLKTRCLNDQIDKYYEWIINSIEKNMLFYKIEIIFAFSSRKISLHELEQMCSTEEEKILFILNKLYPLILHDDNNEYYVFHNDIRLHFRNEVKTNSAVKYLTGKLYNNILKNDELEIYRYDILFELLFSLNDITTLFDLVNAEYIIRSIKYNISINFLERQFSRMMKLVEEQQELCYLDKLSTIALALSQFANCIQYYEKEKFYIENKMPSRKLESEKYILDSEKDMIQIVEDIYYLLKNKEEKRARSIFHEYLIGKKLENLLCEEYAKGRDFFEHVGYICRVLSPEILENNDDNEYYADFVDGWLQASSNYLTVEEINRTFSFKKFYPYSLNKYIEAVSKKNYISNEIYQNLENKLIQNYTPNSVLIELCCIGLFKGYKNNKLKDYLNKNIKELLVDETYQYDWDRLEGFVKLLFCIYDICNREEVDKVYQELLVQCKIEKTSRGYKPAYAQIEIATEIFDIFYGKKSQDIKEDTIYDIIYLGNKYGSGSCYDCNAYKVLDFVKKVYVCYAKNNAEDNQISKVCDILVDILKWEKPRHINEFDILFYYAEEKEKFLEVTNYWCGEQGKIWNEDYTIVEGCCNSVINVLKLFEEYQIADTIEEIKSLKIFGYIGRKDYSMMNLVDFYGAIRLSKDKLLDMGMELLNISDSATNIGDNRTSIDIDKEIFEVAVELGIKYANAIFELKNEPKKLIYWRRLLIEALYNNIDNISDDKELISLYYLTNAWINARFESHKEHGYLDDLKKYNDIILRKVKSSKLRNIIVQNGNYKCKLAESRMELEKESEYEYVYQILKNNGYTEDFEEIINNIIIKNNGGVLKLLMNLSIHVDREKLMMFVNNCIVTYILSIGYYDFSHYGVKNLLEMYGMYLSKESWGKIYNNILNKFSEEDIYMLDSLSSNLEVLTLYYYKNFYPEQMEYIFKEMCNVHNLFITADGQLKNNCYKLVINNNITSIQKMVEFQLNSNIIVE